MFGENEPTAELTLFWCLLSEILGLSQKDIKHRTIKQTLIKRDVPAYMTETPVKTFDPLRLSLLI